MYSPIECNYSSLHRTLAAQFSSLTKHEWVHLACRGLPNPKQPLESAFTLRNGQLTIHHILACSSMNHEFAYLSVCHTAVGGEESLDEAVHLTSAVQFAGFLSVIGTMWVVDDSEAAKTTSAFYKLMLDKSGHLGYTRTAFVLNNTMETANIPLDQRILYVHLGA